MPPQNAVPQVASQGFEYGVKHFNSIHTDLLSQVVTHALNLNETEFEALLQLGSIYVNNQRQRFNVTINEGSLVRVHTKPRRYFKAYDWKSRIVYEDSDFLILNKPAGIPSHPSVDNFVENSLTQTEIAIQTKLHISHRLDTTTEGLIVYGKTTDFVRAFNIQLENKSIEKKYVALVHGESKSLDHHTPIILFHYMEQTPRAPKIISDIHHDKWLPCELRIERLTDHEWTDGIRIKHVHLNLLTGRTHQIRSQMAFIGFPLLGDSLYGSPIDWTSPSNPPDYFGNSQIALRSQSIDFIYKQKRQLFELPLNFIDSY